MAGTALGVHPEGGASGVAATGASAAQQQATRGHRTALRQPDWWTGRAKSEGGALAAAEVASRRVALLDAAVSRRSRRQTEARHRRQYATFGRAAVAAAAFAASGGSLVAPVTVSLGVLYAPPFQSRSEWQA